MAHLHVDFYEDLHKYIYRNLWWPDPISEILRTHYGTPCTLVSNGNDQKLTPTTRRIHVSVGVCSIANVDVCARTVVAECKELRVDSIAASTSLPSPSRPALQPLNNKGISCSFYFLVCTLAYRVAGHLC